MNNDRSVQALHLRQGELLDELDELEQAIAELAALVMAAGENDQQQEQRERLAWLYRQQAGVLAVLSETERALLASGSAA
jgi:hypothetical protein